MFFYFTNKFLKHYYVNTLILNKTTKVAIATAFVLGSVLSLVTVNAEEGLIPSWIKTTAGFWVNDQVSDSEFISALQFLVKEGILVIPEDKPATSPIIVTPPSTTLPPTPSPITQKYLPILEAFNIEGDRTSLLISILGSNGKPVSVAGELIIERYDHDGYERFSEKKYIRNENFEDFKNEISGETTKAFQWTIPTSRLSYSDYLTGFNGLGTMKIIFKEKDQTYENEVEVNYLPLNEAYFNEDTGFIDNFEVNKILDVGPFFVTVANVGRYMGEDISKGDAPKEFFKVNLKSKVKYIEGVTYILDEMYMLDNKNNIYSSDDTTTEMLHSIFEGETVYDIGRYGYVIFEKVPSDITDLKLILKITRVEGDVSNTHYEGEIDISLR